MFSKEDGTIRNEVRLSAAQTKGGQPRTVFLPKKLQDELAIYLATRYARFPDVPFFHTSKRLGFSANSLCQWFFWAYRNAGIAGASSPGGPTRKANPPQSMVGVLSFKRDFK